MQMAAPLWRTVSGGGDVGCGLRDVVRFLCSKGQKYENFSSVLGRRSQKIACVLGIEREKETYN
jgi:hypothetical protein